MCIVNDNYNYKVMKTRKIMNRLLKNALFLLTFCLCLIPLCFCSNNDKGLTEEKDINLVSTDLDENAVVDISLASVSFTFDQGIYVADNTKITLNGIAVPDVSVYGTSLKVKFNSLESGTDYTLTIGIGAIKNGSNDLNKDAFSVKFQTKELPVNGGSVTQNGFLSVHGVSLVNQDGKVVVLHGVSLGWHNWWPRFYNEQTITWLHSDWKCDYVRAAIGANADQNCYVSNPASSLNCLYTVVDAAIKNDMYVIVDWHAGSILLDDAKGFFQTVAGKYKDCPNIIYEIFNEPDNTFSWSSVKAYSEEVIKTIREIAPKNIILVGSPSWDQSVDLPAADPIKDYDNLMYTLHFYAGSHGQWLRDRATGALSKGLPLFVSECGGMDASGDGAINTQEWQAWLQWMKDNSVSWDAWDIADKNESCSMIANSSSPVSGWTDNDLKEWGQLVRSVLRNMQ